MAAFRTCIFVSLACFRPATSAPIDEFFLIQKEVQQAALQRSPLSADAQQLPFQLPGNVPLDVMNVGMDFLAAFRNKAFVNTMYAGLKNFTSVADGFSRNMTKNAVNLSKTSQRVGPERAMWLLEHFLLQVDDAMAAMLASYFGNAKVLLAAVPSGSFKGGPEALMAKLTDVNMEEVQKNTTSTLRASTKDAFGNRTGFCQSFRPALENLSKADLFLADEVVPKLKVGRSTLLVFQPMITGLAPDVGPEAVRFLNTSLAALSSALTSLSFSYHMAVKTVGEVAEHRVNCSVLSPVAAAPETSAALSSATSAAQAVPAVPAAPAAEAERAGAAPGACRGSLPVAAAAAAALLAAAK